MAKLSNEELQQLILRGETSTVELKIAPPRPTELAERLCGMANAQGGILIIGVDDAHRIVGVSNTRLAVDTILRAARQIQPALLLDPLEPEIYTVSGKQLVVASIPRHTGPLYQSSGVCWVRRGTYTVPYPARRAPPYQRWHSLFWPQPTTTHSPKRSRVHLVSRYAGAGRLC